MCIGVSGKIRRRSRTARSKCYPDTSRSRRCCPGGRLAARRSWPGAEGTTAVFLNRAGSRLSVRAADEIIAGIARAAGIEDAVTPHVLRHTFATDLARAGTDLVTVAELLGHASIDSTRIYTLPTEDDLDAAIARLTVDR